MSDRLSPSTRNELYEGLIHDTLPFFPTKESLSNKIAYSKLLHVSSSPSPSTDKKRQRPEVSGRATENRHPATIVPAVVSSAKCRASGCNKSAVEICPFCKEVLWCTPEHRIADIANHSCGQDSDSDEDSLSGSDSD